MYRTMLLILLQALMVSLSPAQTLKDLRFENISVNDGLSQSTGRVIIQDHKGFIWIGTQDGLNKYDGHSFIVYNNDPLDTNSMADNFIQEITEDENGMLWIGYNSGGIDCFDPDNEIFTHFKHQPADSNSLSHNFINHIYFDRAGIMWVGTANGADILNRETGTFQRIHFKVLADSRPFINCFYEDRQHRFWIGTGASGLVEYDRASGMIVNLYQHDPSAN